VTTSRSTREHLAQQTELSQTERLLGCSVTALPTPSLSRQDPDERIESLLEWMVGVVRGASGAVLLADEDGRLAVKASIGIDSDACNRAPTDASALTFGLIVHAAEIDAEGQHGGRHDGMGRCSHGIVDPESRMAVSLPLEIGGRLLGGVQVGFADLRSLDPAEIRRLGMIADHIASAAEAARLARESVARLSEIERVSHVLHEVERMKNDFLSMISHELRTPLTAIIGYTDLLLREVHGALTDRQLHHQRAVKKAAHRLLALINDLLDLNRLEGGHVVLNLEGVSLVDAVRLAVSRATEQAEPQRVELRMDAPVASLMVQADPERLQQVLVNLLDNAIKFTPSGGRVAVRVDHDEGQATVAVIDTGVGVPPDQLDRIWDRFHQADSSTRRQFGGTGLGLAIVRHLVELHGGKVAVASDGPGQGSTFTFTLPLSQAVARPADLAPSAGQAAGSQGVKTVLIVDDEPDNREVITAIVHDVMGHEAVTAVNGAEALARARSQPDLVLLDLRMPGLSGFDVARALKRDPLTLGIPIIAITALDAEDDRREAIDAGCLGCVTKPFSEESLTTAVSKVLAASAPWPQPEGREPQLGGREPRS
jgi:signal transduction histidine kinase/ActR/RegA family two-component response regulator